MNRQTRPITVRTISFLSIAVLVMAGTAAAKYSSGTGEPNDPYAIATAADLNDIGNHQEDWDKHFSLVNNVNLAGYTGTQFNIIGRYFGPNDPNNKPFTGVFEGNGHTVGNFKWVSNNMDCIGLFGWVGSGGEIKNLGMENVKLTGPYQAEPGDEMGGLVGYNGGTITNCYSTGEVSGNNLVGGLTGYNSGSITNCYSTTHAGGYGSGIGGLVGTNSGTVSTSYSIGEVGAAYNAGGLVGSNFGLISQCYSTADVNAYAPEPDGCAGGLVGRNVSGEICESYSAGRVSGAAAGGLVGKNEFGPPCDCEPYSFWDVNKSGQSKSACGIGKTPAEMTTKSTFTDAGWDFDNIWTIDEFVDYPRFIWQVAGKYSGGTGMSNNPYRIATPDDLNNIGNHKYDWNKHFILINDVNLAQYTGTQFKIIGNSTKPFTGVFDGNDHKVSSFTWSSTKTNYYIGLFGCVGSAGQIKNLYMENVDVNATNGVYVGGLVGYNVRGTITNCYSTGSIVGNGHIGGLMGYNDGSIYNCYSKTSVEGDFDVGGLVGLNYQGTISSCYATCYATGSILRGGNIGGLVGANVFGTISDCYSTGVIDGNEYIGGLVGYNDGPISNSYSTGSVAGTHDVGGLVGLTGWRVSTISDSYSSGTVEGGNRVGGLVGSSNNEVTDCYSTGRVTGTGYYVGGLVGYGGAVNSFWDIETSGQLTSAGGIPKTTEEMKTKSTFTDAGWDFVGETVNGPNDVWWMCVDGVDYPRLTWESVQAGDFACPDGVNTEDLILLCDDWLLTYSRALYGADANGDREVTFGDFAVLAENWIDGP